MIPPPFPPRILLAASLLLGGGLALDAKLGLDREAYGVWDRSGFQPVEQYPFTRGQEWSTGWEHVHPARGVYDWSELDELLEFAHQQNQKVFIKVQPVSGLGEPPAWIYGAGVPKLSDRKYTYGYYLDPEFKLYFSEMVQAMGDHVRNNVPDHLLELVAFVRVDTGATGDEEPYEYQNRIPSAYKISDADWQDYRLWVFELYRQAFQEGPGAKIPLLFQAIDPTKDTDEWNWVSQNVTAGFGAKFGGLVRGHHMTNSNTVTIDFKDKAVDSDFGLFSRNEMDQTWSKTFFQLNIRLNMYWTAVEQLQPGMSVWDVTKSCLQNTYIDGYAFAFEFFNTWAAELDPPTARGGFSILHEGLDFDDKEKFPESIYGEKSPENLDRYLAICEAYADQGAQMDDVDSAPRGQVYQRANMTGFNDCARSLWAGNYERFIRQIDPDNTSKGLFRVNGPLTPSSHPYDRFARSFDSTTGKNTMYFDVHDNLLPSRSQRVQLSVIYLDKGTGQFELEYDATDNSQKSAFVVTKTNSNTWKTETVVVDDWVMANNGPNGADLMLLNIDSEDDIFHMVELVKLAEVVVVTEGQGTVTGRTDATIYDPVIGTFAEGQRLELTVTPAPGWEFSGWSGDLDGTNPRPILYPTEDTQVTAHFTRVGETSTWFGFKILNDYVDTGAWLGWVHVANDPWVYSENLGSWMYAPEQSGAFGAWFHLSY
ncbi:T9SS C-terminal target domain-containing protein [Puniceicoccales bacterium CK1056]|uniref:T9SS C-terminal target domain-containing protein n=1 Tax=Oceanipulchritudo coccoides TaxID=2706888 RepID=A0A6B2LY76_9BACT|nr:beta-galactosidase [Oceanipulchritudo coccoides]NDV61009.1 T9SS C-terminal target domain-containing protein [Oceanipulchritudo coccoides]